MGRAGPRVHGPAVHHYRRFDLLDNEIFNLPKGCAASPSLFELDLCSNRIGVYITAHAVSWFCCMRLCQCLPLF